MDKTSDALYLFPRVGVHHMREIMADDLKNATSSQQLLVTEPEDRLSCLPLELQSLVLSLLPLHVSLKTCILSKMWRKRWHSLPYLIFDYGEFPNMEGKLDHFLEFIQHALIHHDESNIIDFELYIKDSGTHMQNEWVVFSVQHNVHNLALHGWMEDQQQLPSCLFKCISLIRMDLAIENLLLKWPTDIRMPNLKKLNLEYVILSEENFILDLSSSCPALETLSIQSCNVMAVKVLSISSLGLTSILISGSQGITECSVKLDTPRLEWFVYMDFVARDYSFANLRSLSFSCVFFRDTHQMERRDAYSKCTIKVFQALCNAEHLSFNETFMEFLSRPHYISRLLTGISFDKLVTLSLFLWPIKEQVQMAFLLLGTCPGIQSLVIEFRRSEGRILDLLDQDDEYGNLALPLMFKQITHIRIVNFGGNKSEMGMARVLLENAPEFSKMEIVMDLSLLLSERKLKMTQILMLKSELQMLTYFCHTTLMLTSSPNLPKSQAELYALLHHQC